MIGATVWPSSCMRRLEVTKNPSWSHYQLIKGSSKASVVYNIIASQARSIELFHVQQRTQRLRPPQTADSEAMNSAAKRGSNGIDVQTISKLILRSYPALWIRLPHLGHIHHFAPKSDQAGVRPDEEQPIDHPISHIYHGNRSCGHLAARGHCHLIKGGDHALQRYDKQRGQERHCIDTRSVWMNFKVRIYE